MKNLLLLQIMTLALSASASPGQIIEITGAFTVPYRGFCQSGVSRAEKNSVQEALVKCASNVRQVTAFADRGSDCVDIMGGPVLRQAKFECLAHAPGKTETLITQTFTVNEARVHFFIYGSRSIGADQGGPLGLGNLISDKYIEEQCRGTFVRIRPYLRAAKPTGAGEYEVVTNASYLCNEQPVLL